MLGYLEALLMQNLAKSDAQNLAVRTKCSMHIVLAHCPWEWFLQKRTSTSLASDEHNPIRKGKMRIYIHWQEIPQNLHVYIP